MFTPRDGGPSIEVTSVRSILYTTRRKKMMMKKKLLLSGLRINKDMFANNPLDGQEPYPMSSSSNKHCIPRNYGNDKRHRIDRSMNLDTPIITNTHN
jgi:hypothetical protein